MQNSFCLPHQNSPILLFEQLYSPQESINTFLVATVDGNVYKIGVNGLDFLLYFQFKLKFACTCFFYGVSRGEEGGVDDTKNSSKISFNNKLVLGCSNGAICTYNEATKTLSPTSYIPPVPSAEPLCLYLRKSTIIAWHLDSLILLLDQQTMAVKNRVNLKIDITAITVIRSRQLQDCSACVAFKGEGEPFVFDCGDGMGLLTGLNGTREDRRDMEREKGMEERGEGDMEEEGDWLDRPQTVWADEEIQMLVYDQSGDTLIAASSSPFNIYFITLYKVQPKSPHTGASLSPILRLQRSLRPIFLHLHYSSLFVGEWQKVQLIDLETRKISFSVKKSRYRWGFLLHARKQNQVLQFKFLTAKGMNLWDLPGSGLGAVKLVLKEGRHVYAD